MRPKHLVAILILLALTLPATPAHAGGVVSICDEAHLLEALAGGGTVTFSCSGTITLTNGIAIQANTTIDGTGQTVTISGNHAGPVFYVFAGVALSVNRLTIANGNSGIHNMSGTVTVSNSTFSGNSGGISQYDGTVTVSNSTFSGNSAEEDGGGIDITYGTVTVSNSTFSGNNSGTGGFATGSGGGIYNYDGTVTVSNSTFYGNSSGINQGGAIHNQYGELTVTNSTFSGNSAGYGGGGGIYNHMGGATLRNTIVADSPRGGNCSGTVGTITDGGGNLSYPDTTCPGINANPLLGPLQNNGGPTETMALLPGSAAVNAANDAICAAPPVNNLDQRGVTRPQGPHCDIGAYEAEPAITACKQDTEGAAIKDWLMTLTGPEPQSGRTLANGCITWTVTKPGAYTATEEARAGWTPQDVTSADFNVVSDGGPYYSHTFVNFKDVSITACKQDTEGAAIKDWLMTLTGPEPKSGRTLANGCISWTVTQPGAYTVTEEDRTGWTHQGPVSVDLDVVSDGGPYSHTFANFKDVTITACKRNTENAPIAGWQMTLTGPDPKSGDTLANGCIAWTVTKPGAYTVTEEDRAGWTHQGATSADFNVVSSGGPYYSHTFVNFKDVSITACKQDTEGAAIKDWLMTLTGPEPQSGKTLDDGCITWTVTKPGAYTVTEEARAGWTPQDATSADFNVVSGGGPNYSHTFVNRRPTIYLPLIMR